MGIKTISIILGAAGFAIAAIEIMQKNQKRQTCTEKDRQNAWFYCSQFREDVAREALEEFRRKNPDVKITHELHSKIIHEAFDKYKDQLV